VKAVADALDVSRSHLVEQLKDAPPIPRSRTRPDDEWLLPMIKTIVDERASYGYRRVTALLNRQLVAQGKARVNHKRIYRIMGQNQLLLERHTGKSTRTHEGVIITLKSNLRWCSDGFEIRCWNGERVQVAFSLDCCDREAMRYVATTGGLSGEMIRDLMVESVEYRFGPGTQQVPHPLEWLSDNGPCYTATETVELGRALGFLVCTTPAYSPESNGMAESFVKSFKRDYVYLNRLESAEAVLKQLPGWFDDYNRIRPHRGLNMRSPWEYRVANSTR
jgi:transposase InsO family protein